MEKADKEELIRQINKAIIRLRPMDEWVGVGLQEKFVNEVFSRKFIYPAVPNGELLKLYRASNNNTRFPLGYALNNKLVLEQTVKIVGLLRQATTWEQFENLFSIHIGHNETIDFDAVLRKLLQ